MMGKFIVSLLIAILAICTAEFGLRGGVASSQASRNLDKYGKKKNRTIVLKKNQTNHTKYEGNKTKGNRTEYEGNKTKGNHTEYEGNKTKGNRTEYEGNHTGYWYKGNYTGKRNHTGKNKTD